MSGFHSILNVFSNLK